MLDSSVSIFNQQTNCTDDRPAWPPLCQWNLMHAEADRRLSRWFVSRNQA